MIKAIIFDCFGVLTTDGWLPFKRKHFSNDPERELQATDLNKQVDAGLADYDQFLRDIAALAGVSVAEARVSIEDNVANQELFAYIRRVLKPRFKIGMLSNAGGDWIKDLFDKDQAELLGATSLSCQTGFVKPDERAYHDIANKLGVDPGTCIFVDDQPRYCTAAEAVGMRTVVYQSTEQCIRDIDRLLA